MATIINGTLEAMAICSRCGQAIKNVSIVDGKPYGLDCASSVLGLKELPVWFKGGDYNIQKVVFDKRQAESKLEEKEAKERIFEFWDDIIELNRIYSRGNEWVKNFILSISSQLGLNCIGCTYYKTAEEHVENTESILMSWFPNKNARHISTLSEKQLNLLRKNGYDD